MRLFLSIENGKADQFEIDLFEFDFTDFTRRERDFMTDFIFEDCDEREEAILHSLEQNFNSGN